MDSLSVSDRQGVDIATHRDDCGAIGRLGTRDQASTGRGNAVWNTGFFQLRCEEFCRLVFLPTAFWVGMEVSPDRTESVVPCVNPWVQLETERITIERAHVCVLISEAPPNTRRTPLTPLAAC
jgi:hypothetical protein